MDEAHATGILGPQGHGLIAKYALMDRIFAQITTFGKAFGTHGAIVLGSRTLKQALINFSTPYIYTTALPFHSLADTVLRKAKSAVTVKSILLEEQEHLNEMTEGLKQLSSGFIHAEHVCRIEQHLYQNWFKESERVCYTL